jgi:hypothetical protein
MAPRYRTKNHCEIFNGEGKLLTKVKKKFLSTINFGHAVVLLLKGDIFSSH